MRPKTLSRLLGAGGTVLVLRTAGVPRRADADGQVPGPRELVGEAHAGTEPLDQLGLEVDHVGMGSGGDLNAAADLVDRLRTGSTTPDGRSLSRLRALDIVICEHQVTACSG